MIPRSFWLGLVVGGAGMVLAGCEGLHQSGLRSKDQAEMPVFIESDEDQEDESPRPAALKGFFKPTRLPGGLSSEASEIERSLGVYD